jgi:predicted metal-dependent peptidase
MGKLRFIGYNNSDYLGFLFRPGHEQDFLEGLADELAGKNIIKKDGGAKGCRELFIVKR